MVQEPAARPLKRPRPPSPFTRLAATHVAATASEAFVTVALAGTLFFTVSPASARPRVALFLVLTMAPFALVAPVLGPLMDRARSGRRLFVVLTCAGRAVLAWLMSGHPDSLLLFPEAFGILVLSKGYQVAKSSIVPSVIEDDESLVEANSRLALVAVLGSFVGGLPAAGVLQLFGGDWALRMAAVLYTVAALTAMKLPRAVPRPPERADLARAELRGATVLLAASAMAALRAGVGFLTFFLAFALPSAALAVLALRAFHLRQGDRTEAQVRKASRALLLAAALPVVLVVLTTLLTSGAPLGTLGGWGFLGYGALAGATGPVGAHLFRKAAADPRASRVKAAETVPMVLVMLNLALVANAAWQVTS